MKIHQTDAKGEFIALNAYVKNEEIPQINDLKVCLKKLDKEEQRKPQVTDVKKQ
jgi:hypothetical protein